MWTDLKENRLPEIWMNKTRIKSLRTNIKYALKTAPLRVSKKPKFVVQESDIDLAKPKKQFLALTSSYCLQWRDKNISKVAKVEFELQSFLPITASTPQYIRLPLSNIVFCTLNVFRVRYYLLTDLTLADPNWQDWSQSEILQNSVFCYLMVLSLLILFFLLLFSNLLSRNMNERNWWLRCLAASSATRSRN